MYRFYTLFLFTFISVPLNSQEVSLCVFDKTIDANLIHEIYIYNSTKSKIEIFSIENNKARFSVNSNDSYKFFAPFYNELVVKGIDLLHTDTLILIPKHQEYDLIEVERYAQNSLIKEWNSYLKKNRNEIRFSNHQYLNFLQTYLNDTLVESYYSRGKFDAPSNPYKITFGDFRFGKRKNFINLNLNDLILSFLPFNSIKLENNLHAYLLPSKGSNKRLNGFQISSNSNPSDSLIHIKI